MRETSNSDRRTFLRRAGLGSLAAASLGAPSALAGSSNGQRVYDFVALSDAPPSGSVLPRIGTRGCGTFKADAGYVKGGGTYVLFDQASPTPKTILAEGEWRPAEFLSYDTLGLPPYGTIQPSILEMLADFEGLVSGAVLRVICNVGAAGAAGSTGQAEGYKLFGTPFGDFLPISPCPGVVLGLSHIGLEGVSIRRGA